MTIRERMLKMADRAAMALGAVLVVTGLALTRVDPPWSIRKLGLPINPRESIFGLSAGLWVDLHYVVATLLLISLLPNLVELGAVVSFVRHRVTEGSVRRGAVGLAALAALLVMSIGTVFPHRGVARGDEEARKRELAAANETLAVEKLTLADIEKRWGVPPAYMREKLNLPSTVSPDSPLSSLMREHRFTFTDVQQVVYLYRSEHMRQPDR